jgi:bifunctional protein hldE
MENTLLEIIDALMDVENKRVVIIGDIILDEYIYGCAGRVSTGIKIPIIKKNNTTFRLGGAGNVAANVAGLSKHTFLYGRFGNDDAGKIVVSLCRDNGITLCEPSSNRTSIKQRIYVDKQQIFRLDSDYYERAYDEELIYALRYNSPDVIIVADYLLGTIRKNTLEIIKKYIDSNVNCKLFFSSRDLSKYGLFENVNLVINEKELQDYQEKLNITIDEILNKNTIYMTRGDKGIVFLDKTERIEQKAYLTHVTNVSGAGDTVLAVLATLNGENIVQSKILDIANIAGREAVKDELTYVIDRNVLIEAIYKSLINDNNENKIVTGQLAKIVCSAWKNRGEKIVFTNGCFDLLHLGHIKSFQYSKRFGDKLVVAVNSDTIIKMLKGKDRPINKLEERLSNLAYLEMIDMVIPFNENTAVQIIKKILPDVYIKGEEYRDRSLPEAQYVPQVEYVPMVMGASTTTLIEKILEAYKND